MQSFTIGSGLNNISYQRFINLSHEFKRQCEEEFGTECSLSIKFMSGKPFYQNHYDPDIRYFEDQQAETLVIYEADNFRDATSDLFNVAAFTKVQITPVDKDKAPNSASGSAEFIKKRRADFYIQGNKKDISLTV